MRILHERTIAVFKKILFLLLFCLLKIAIRDCSNQGTLGHAVYYGIRGPQCIEMMHRLMCTAVPLGRHLRMIGVSAVSDWCYSALLVLLPD